MPNNIENNHLRMLVFGFRRGGSSITFSIIQNLFLDSGLKAQDLAAEFYRSGVDTVDIPSKDISDALASNDLVGCFRAKPDLSCVDWTKTRPILIMRDPRDCQLSWFHARYLHVHDAVPVRPLDDALPYETLCEDEDLARDMDDLFAIVSAQEGLIIRYEDLVIDPVGFLDRLIEFTKLPFSRSAYDAAVVSANFLQGLIDLQNHNRSGIPQEQLRKLDSHTRNLLNDRFGELAQKLGYPLHLDKGIAQSSLNRLKERDAIKRYLLSLATENALRARDVDELRTEVRNLNRDLTEVGQQNELLVNLCEQMAQSVTSFAMIVDQVRDQIKIAPTV